MVVSVLVVISQVETFFLCFVACAYAYGVFQNQQNHEGDECRPCQRSTDSPQLRDNLCVSIEVSNLVGDVIPYASAAEFWIDEYAGTDRANDTADTVHAECIQCIVIFQLGLEHGYGEEANNGSRGTDSHGTAHADKSCGRSDRYQACNDAGADAQQAWFALDYPFD